MNNDSTQKRCDSCGAKVPTYDGVHLSDEHTNRYFCSKCHNESVAEAMGLNFEHLSFQPIILADEDNEHHTFHFQTRLFGENVLMQALEIKGGSPKGYEFSVHGNAEDDLFALFGKLVERMRRRLARRHIEPSDLTRYSIADEDIVRGQITWDDDTDGEVPCLVIDGKELSWHEFGRMLMTYEGFHFKLQIFEGSEEK